MNIQLPYRNTIKHIANLLFALSGAAFTFLLSLSSNVIEIIAGVALSFIICVVACKHDILSKIVQSLGIGRFLISIIMTFYYVGFIGENSYLLSIESENTQFLYNGLILLSALFVMCILMVILKSIGRVLTELVSQSARYEKFFFLGGFIFLICLITILYLITSGFWNSFDIVYSIDAGWCTKRIFPNLYYADIRHVNFTILTFPIHIAADFISSIFGDSPYLYQIVLAIINSSFLLAIGILLKKITANYYVLALYMTSAPVWIFAVFVEKYNISTFLLVLFTYGLVKKKKQLAVISGVLAVGAMSTSIFIWLAYLINGTCNKPDGKGHFKRSVINFLGEIGSMSIKFLSLLIILGRLNYIIHAFDYVNKTLNSFASSSLNLIERVYASFDGIASCFFIQPFLMENQTVTWSSIGERLNILGVLIFLVCLIGFRSRRKEQMVKVFGLWAAFLFILFIIIGWSPAVSPLFSLYFSWAYIPLFVFGVERLFVCNAWKVQCSLIVIMLCMLLTNIYHLFQLTAYLRLSFPV